MTTTLAPGALFGGALRAPRASLSLFAELRRTVGALRRLEDSGVDAAVRGRPAGAPVPGAAARESSAGGPAAASAISSRAGGDRVEIVDLGARRTLIALIDAHGPGESARELASALAAHVRFAAARHHEPPTLLLASSDELVRRSFRGERGAIASMLVLLVDAAHHTVRIANAGMPSPLVGGRAGICVPLGERGPALGVVSGVVRTETGPIRLSPGQILVAATDGVSEAASADGSTFGADRLAHALTDRRADGPAAVAREIIARTDAWTSPEDSDDRTVFAMRLR